MDNTLTQILEALFKAHQAIDTLRAVIAERDAQIAQMKKGQVPEA